MTDLSRRGFLGGVLAGAAALATPRLALPKLITDLDPDEVAFYSKPPGLRKSFFFMPTAGEMTPGGIARWDGRYYVRLVSGLWSVLWGVGDDGKAHGSVRLQSSGTGHIVTISREEWERQTRGITFATGSGTRPQQVPQSFVEMGKDRFYPSATEQMIHANEARSKAVFEGLAEKVTEHYQRGFKAMDIGRLKSEWVAEHDDEGARVVHKPSAEKLRKP
jgi:hypothetical protein